MQSCDACGVVKPWEEFHRDKQKKTGYRRKCKACIKEYGARRHAENPDRYKEQRKRRYQERREEVKAQQRAYRAANREKIAEARRKRWAGREDEQRRAHNAWRHGLTLEQYDGLLNEQKGACACCGDPLKKIHVDHDHDCCPVGARSCGSCVRGLLCPHCNLMLGHAKDERERLLAGVEYLDRWYDQGA